jgi:hypothetical protein
MYSGLWVLSIFKVQSLDCVYLYNFCSEDGGNILLQNVGIHLSGHNINIHGHGNPNLVIDLDLSMPIIRVLAAYHVIAFVPRYVAVSQAAACRSQWVRAA